MAKYFLFGGLIMKYCPYCGAAVRDTHAAFCTECGRELLATDSEKPTHRKKRFAFKPFSKRRTKPKEPPLQAELPSSVDGAVSEESIEQNYDGYYDDILPPDTERKRNSVDRTLVIRVAALIGTVLLIITLCVLALYLL